MDYKRKMDVCLNKAEELEIILEKLIAKLTRADITPAKASEARARIVAIRRELAQEWVHT